MNPQNPNYPQGVQGPYSQSPAYYPTPLGYPGPHPGGYPGPYPGGPWPPPPPLASPNTSRAKIVAAALAAAVVLGGGGYATYHYTQNFGASACSVKNAKTVVLIKKQGDEPTITIPATEGWETYERGDINLNTPVLDSPIIRGFIVNPGIKAKNFAPNVVVTLERFPDPDATAEQINEVDAWQVGDVATVVSQSVVDICGATVYRKDLAGIAAANDDRTQTGTTLLTVIDGGGGNPWVVTATIQTREPNNPKYIAQLDALLAGFRVTAGER